MSFFKCSNCGKIFQKKKIDGRYKNHFCSRECQDAFDKKGKQDDLSPFRYFLHKISSKSKAYNETSDIDLDFLKKLWSKQKGICPYCGLKMKLPKTCNESINSPLRASLDRINSSRGYFKDNVEFTCQFVNLGKNTFSKDEMMDIFKKIRK